MPKLANGQGEARDSVDWIAQRSSSQERIEISVAAGSQEWATKIKVGANEYEVWTKSYPTHLDLERWVHRCQEYLQMLDKAQRLLTDDGIWPE